MTSVRLRRVEPCLSLNTAWGGRVAVMGLAWLFLFPVGDVCSQPHEAVTELQRQVIAAIEQAEKSVVAIARVPKRDTAAAFQLPNLGGLGTRIDEAVPTDIDFVPNDFAAGVVVDRQGLIATTYHVIGDTETSNYYVWSQHKPYRASVIAADGWFDLAVLKIQQTGLEPTELKPIVFGDAKSVEKGQFIVALGNPQAIARDGEASAASGIVSNLLRRAPRVPERSVDPLGRETVHHYGTLIQTDLALGMGFSGGALVNLQGEMIGMTTAYAGGARHPRSAGFAIPVDEYFRLALERLKAGKAAEFGILGVNPRPLDVRLRQQGHVGTRVEAVEAETPAELADIRPGDVIQLADGQPVYDDDDLIRIIGSLPPDRTVQLTIFRGDLSLNQGDTLQKRVTLAKKRVGTIRPPIATVPPPSWRGMRLDYASAAPKQVLNSARLPSQGGRYLHVTEVAPDSQAWEAGIRPNTFVTRVGETPVISPREFFAAVEPLNGEVVLQIIDSNGTRTTQTVSP